MLNCLSYNCQKFFWQIFCMKPKSIPQIYPATSKFGYLKEHLEPKVRVDIDGLSFNTEGYEHAKKY